MGSTTEILGEHFVSDATFAAPPGVRLGMLLGQSRASSPSRIVPGNSRLLRRARARASPDLAAPCLTTEDAYIRPVQDFI
jgi:hypothetical protein